MLGLRMTEKARKNTPIQGLVVFSPDKVEDAEQLRSITAVTVILFTWQTDRLNLWCVKGQNRGYSIEWRLIQKEDRPVV